jgi:hypothetical protein
MTRSISTTLALVTSLVFCACEPSQDPQPLAAFTDYRLQVGTHHLVLDGGGVDPDHYSVTLVLWRPESNGSYVPPCLAISTQVTATLDEQVMKSYAEGSGHALGGCTEPVFTLAVPRSRFPGEGGVARFVLSDSTHAMVAEFQHFYEPVPNEPVRAVPVLRCEGVAECKGFSPPQSPP